jgi:hypothetical protein
MRYSFMDECQQGPLYPKLEVQIQLQLLQICFLSLIQFFFNFRFCLLLKLFVYAIWFLVLLYFDIPLCFFLINQISKGT